MLRKKALRKILVTTVSLFIIMAIYLIPMAEEKTIQTNLELEYITGLGNHSIYLLDEKGYLVKTKVLLDGSDVLENINLILSHLISNSTTKFPEALLSLIPNETKILDVTIEDKIVIVNFSNKFLTVTKDLEHKMVESIVFSLTELDGIDGVKIQVEGNPFLKYPNSGEILDEVLTRKIGINRKYDLTNTKDINKVVIYYVESLDDNSYYVPVTKYINDSRDKIDIIVEELTTGYIYEPNLMSLLNESTKLTSYHQEDDLMILNFNDALFDHNGTIKEEVLYTLSYSVFENYDVMQASFCVNDKQVKTVKRNEIP